MSALLHRARKASQLAALLLAFASTLLAGVGPSFSQICTDARLLQSIFGAVDRSMHFYYSSVVSYYGQNSPQAQQAGMLVAAVTRVIQNYPDGACNIEDVKFVLYEAFNLSRQIGSNGQPAYPELHASSAEIYTLFVNIQNGSSFALTNCQPPPPPPGTELKIANCGPVMGYTGEIRNLRRGSARPNDGGIWLRDHSLRWFRYAEDSGRRFALYWDVGRPDGRDGYCKDGFGY